MASRKTTLPSDPEYLLNLLDELSNDKSEDDFDGYVTDSSDEEDRSAETSVGRKRSDELCFNDGIIIVIIIVITHANTQLLLIMKKWSIAVARKA